MSKYFPIPQEYKHNPYSQDFKNDIYSAIRKILRDTKKEPAGNMRYGLMNDISKPNKVSWCVTCYFESRKTLCVYLPFDGSIHEAALMVQMGTHTLEETWEEYKDLWYEDLERQVAHLEKGTGP